MYSPGGGVPQYPMRFRYSDTFIRGLRVVSIFKYIGFRNIQRGISDKEHHIIKMNSEKILGPKEQEHNLDIYEKK